MATRQDIEALRRQRDTLRDVANTRAISVDETRIKGCVVDLPRYIRPVAGEDGVARLETTLRQTQLGGPRLGVVMYNRALANTLVDLIDNLISDANAAMAQDYPQVEAGSQFVPTDIFEGMPGYLTAIVSELNLAYQYRLWNSCAVLSRRVLETLIIEVYEAADKAEVVKANNGNYLMLSDLLKKLEAAPPRPLSRNTKAAIRDSKELGDLAAHNPRFIARPSDLSTLRMPLRVACEELAHAWHAAKDR